MSSFTVRRLSLFISAAIAAELAPNIYQAAPIPATFAPNPSVGGGGGSYEDSPHFRVYGAPGDKAKRTLNHLEAAHYCFTSGPFGWKTHGLSIKGGEDYKKLNAYAVASLGNAAGQQFSDPRTGHAYVKVISSQIDIPRVTVHEYGHALTYYEKNWIDMKRTGAWWEPVANWFADTYLTSDYCMEARRKYGTPEGKTLIELPKVLNNAWTTLVDASKGPTANYYQSWPFITFLHNNPDKVKGLGSGALREMFRQYKKGSNETPLHALDRVAGGNGAAQRLVGRYWARMAYVEIGHRQASAIFAQIRPKINYSYLEAAGAGSYRVKAARAPKYMGANIIPLKGATGTVGVQVTAQGGFTATLAVKGKGMVRYVDLPKGSGSASVSAGEEATLVVANTPATLLLYDAFNLVGDVAKGLQYTVKLTGATA